jgi:homoaconitase
MRAYLDATRRSPVARAADEAATNGFLSADEGAQYDEVIEIVSDYISLHLHPQMPCRICLSLNQLSMDLSRQTWPLLYRSLGLL